MHLGRREEKNALHDGGGRLLGEVAQGIYTQPY